MRYDVALPAPGAPGKARAAERGEPRSRPATPRGASGAGNPQNMTMGRRPSPGNTALSLAHVERPRDAREALSCRGLAADEPPYLMTIRPGRLATRRGRACRQRQRSPGRAVTTFSRSARIGPMACSKSARWYSIVSAIGVRDTGRRSRNSTCAKARVTADRRE